MPDSPYVARGMQNEPAPGGEPVALSALIERGVRLEWHEAVAVVRDICQLLRGADPFEPVPDLRHVWICANGRMAIAPGTAGGRASTEQPVTTLGRLLLALVEEARMPGQLRLVALSAASIPPAYATVDEFSNALAYFERPGGALPIRPVYSRWHALAAESDAPPALQPPAAQEPPPPVLPSPVQQEVVDLTEPSDALDLFLPEVSTKKVVTLPGRRFPVFPIAAGAAVTLVAVVLAAWSFSNRSRLAPGATQAAPAPAEQGASATITERSPAAEDVDLDAPHGSAARGIAGQSERRLPSPAPAGTDRGRFDKATAAEGRGAGPRPASRRAESSPKIRLDLGASNPAAAPVTGASRSAAPRLASPSPAPARQPAIDEQLAVPVGDPEGQVYSGADEDVVPPVLLQPRQRVDLPPGSRAEDLSAFDLLISERGDVEKVRLGAPARDYREAMMLSAIKTWKFKPATKDGRPVRCLKRVWIRLSPMATSAR